MIIGTAGHIDHGKTTLVRALTGVDADRLKEERSRGMTIELGYAYAPMENGDVLGFVDVPGHERLVHTMAAGASGIEFGLLVVAADDGIMPQTREHLAILCLLGIEQGAVVITKIDRADDAQLSKVKHDVANLTRGTFLSGAPMFPVQAAASAAPGVAALAAYLAGRAQARSARPVTGLFRLAVDRVFTLQGHGTVVTGTVHSGHVRVGDTTIDVRLMPINKPLRIRGIHAQNRPSAVGQTGQRCAINLGGIDKTEIQRGDWVADARCFDPSRNIDVELHLLSGTAASGAAASGAQTPLRTWAPLHVHMGAAHYLAHAVPLSSSSLSPGESGKVQLVFDQPVCAMPGDRYIVRNPQARLTVGGGVVLDPDAPDRKRRSPQRLAWLDAMAAWLAGSGLLPLLEQAPHGLDEARLTRLTGIDAGQLESPAGAIWVQAFDAPAGRVLMLCNHWTALLDHIEHSLHQFHQAAPDEPGLDAARLRRIAVPRLEDRLWKPALDALIAQHRIYRHGAWLHRPGHAVLLSDAEAALATPLLSLINAGAFDPPWTRDLARELRQPEVHTRQLLRKLMRRGELFQVVQDLFYHREQVALLAQVLSRLAATEAISAAAFRDATGLGRKRAIQLLDFFGRLGYTRRVRDQHVLRGGAIFLNHRIDAQDKLS